MEGRVGREYVSQAKERAEAIPGLNKGNEVQIRKVQQEPENIR